jgi:hypothetical protein
MPHPAQLKDCAMVSGISGTTGDDNALHLSEWRYSDRWASYTIDPSAPRKRSLSKTDVASNQRDELNLLELYSGRCMCTVA